MSESHPSPTFEHTSPLERVEAEEQANPYAPEKDVLTEQITPEIVARKALEISLPEARKKPLLRRFSSKSVVAGIARWIARKRGIGVTPGPANEQILDESGKLYEAPAREGTIAERHPSWPRMKVTLLLSWHETEGDYYGVRERMSKKPDILLYETSDGRNYLKGRSEATRSLEDLSEGKTTTNPKAEGREGVLLRSIENSRVKIGSIDITDYENRAIALTETSNTPMVRVENYDTMLDIIKANGTKLAEAQNKRDEIMVRRYEPEIERILKQHPELMNKDEIEIFIPLGEYHTKVGHGLRKLGVETVIEFDDLDYKQRPGQPKHSRLSLERSHIYDYETQLYRTLAFGREPKRDLIEKTYGVYMLRQLTPNPQQTTKSKDYTNYLDEVALSLDSKDIQAMHNSFFRGASNEEIREMVNQRLAAKGLPSLITEAI